MRLVLHLAVLLIGGLAVAFFASSALAQDADEADHQALRKLKAVFEQAASENNLDLLKPYVHEKFSAVTYTDREFFDFEAFKARWQKTRDEIVGDGSYKVTLLPERSEIYGDLAITRGDSENVLINSAGKKFEFTSHWTAVCRKIDGEWKIVRAHSSLDPFGNPMLVDGVKSKLVQVGAAAALGGLVLGGIATYLIMRARVRRRPAPTGVSNA
jgi:ketosteroid isomerase-like protein